ncbi:high affinity cAMP-specific and IBMX-insensitive 3',5'-cyclic phosphodiesterase 8A-like isoform X2 [Carassius carassius]|uniref:high affinity cAMP-specific and IBMX-insensitive 3',5'-cyclic phosphodiesterase 8A-like isoform X2 n=1 Tax=Carassius carassius TaxID=217509 RepID=UPI0028686A73|nr:high affinity cAMP-specific and IBMX-insensitive 3',5'-cyclic phosphodiesterase 8A-like isoform X2 [Carassius carassius]
MMGCASSIHISDRVVYQSGKESEDSPQQNCPQPGHTKPSNACQSTLTEVQFGPMKLYEDQLQLIPHSLRTHSERLSRPSTQTRCFIPASDSSEPFQ